MIFLYTYTHSTKQYYKVQLNYYTYMNLLNKCLCARVRIAYAIFHINNKQAVVVVFICKRSAHITILIYLNIHRSTHTRKQYGGDGGGGADLRPLYGTFRHAWPMSTQRAFILIEYICLRAHHSSSHSSFKMMAFM